MSYIYEPEVEEQDDGYSIPKILVAVLLFALIGAGVFIYMQKVKIKESVALLKKDKKEVKKELDSIIAVYNLAMEDNDYLSGAYSEEKARIEEMKNQIDNLPEDGDLSSFKPIILDMKETQKMIAAPVVEQLVVNNIDIERDESESNRRNERIKTKSDTASVVKLETLIGDDNDITKENTTNQTIAKNTSEDIVKTDDVTTEKAVIEEAPKKKVITSILFKNVDVPPIYPTCAGGNIANQKKCFSREINAFVYKEFNSAIASNLGLPEGLKNIYVSMSINKYGKVTNIKVRGAPHKKLEEEAIRVVKKLPKMIPARHEGNVVSVDGFFIPISVNIEYLNSPKTNKWKYI